MLRLLEVSFNPSQGQDDKLLDDKEQLMVGSEISGMKMIYHIILAGAISVRALATIALGERMGIAINIWS